MAGHRTTTFAAGSHVPAGSLNTQQDRAHTLDLATATAAGAPTDTQGADWITYQSPDAGVAAGTVVTLDASDRDWRERLVSATARFVTTALRRWGRADEHVGNDPSTSNNRSAFGVTGPGAVGAAAATVANGTPPVVTTNSCPLPLDVRSDGEVWIFADPTSGALKLYNDTSAALHFDLLIMATGRAPDLSAPPPDLVPTLTEILWLTPSVAASRPANPGAVIAIHRATDTGAITLWDGGAWRTLGLVSPLTTRGDLWVRDASADARLALGTSGYVLTSDGTDAVWAAPASVPPTTYTAADFTTVAGGGSDTATLTGGKIRFVLTGTAARYYSATTRDAPRVKLAIPAGATRVIVVARVTTLTTSGTSYDSLGVLIRGGSDETAAPPSRVQASATYGHRLPSVVHFRDGSNNVYSGDAVTLSYGANVPFTGQSWNGTRWIAIQWDARTGQTYAGLYVSASTPTAPEQFAWTTLNETAPSSLGYGSPTWMVVTGMQPGGSPAALQFDADVLAWVWT